LRILYLNPIGQLGGAERSLIDLLRSLQEHDGSLELSVLTLAEGPLVEAVGALGIEVRVVPLPPALARLGDSGLGVGSLGDGLRAAAALPAFARFERELRRAIRSLSPRILHSNGLKTHVLAAWLKPSGASVVWHLRDFLSSRRVMRSVLPRLEGRASVGICISEAVARDARRSLRRLPLVTVLNGVNTRALADPSIAPIDLDALAGLPAAEPNTVRIGLLATQASWKGHRLFLEAAARLADPSARFYVVGGPIYSTSGSETGVGTLRSEIARLGLSARCGLVPFQVDPRGVYRALDVVVNASTRPEPFGRTVAEALACGRAVIGPSAGGVPEQIVDGVTGRLYPPRDTVSLAQILGSLIASPQERTRLGTAGALEAGTRLDAGRLGPEVTKIYETLRVGYSDLRARKAE
jgi:glycosyltransferase involved in cell wall biosynthesis